MTPPIEAIALHRLGFGPRPGDVEAIRKLGYAAWLDEQLSPDGPDDSACNQRLADAKLRIEYTPTKDEAKAGWGKTNEPRPLSNLDTPLQQLWPLVNYQKKTPWAERARPFSELIAATWIRAVYSRRQLREVMADFWHNHFSVAADTDLMVQLALVGYDRDVIRKHALGNFREMLEAVATNPAMLRYLNNFSSRASPANENYARELFELHTLGAENYFNHLYNRWREVPGADQGQPVGYIDQDVYEAARAFTGWSFESGQWMREGENMPQTGTFAYVAQWHDPYQKRVLAADIEPNAPPMSDGRKVLDRVAFHPGTARHIARKLCRRLVADDPSDAIVAAAAEAFVEHRDAPDQIARVIRVIATHPEFTSTWGQKVKRPMEFVAAVIRATDAEFMPDPGFAWTYNNAGQRLFNWPTPDGHPDRSPYWLGANTMLARWNIPMGVAHGWGPSVKRPPLADAVPEGVNTVRTVTVWIAERMLGFVPEGPTLDALLKFAAAGNDADAPLSPADGSFADRTNPIVALVAMSPEFHLR